MTEAGRRGVPSYLSFALLAFQAALPWTASHFVTQDGPSHLYTAIVAKDLAFRRESPYAAVYRFQPEVMPNWTTTVVLGAAATVAGVGHAEQMLATLAILGGFFSIAYACRAMDPSAHHFSPLINFLLHTWFLWIGFYNFYLGMVLCPLLLGFYLKNIERFGLRQTVILAFGLVLLFFTHLIPAALTVTALVLISAWVHLLMPLLARSRQRLPFPRAGLRSAGLLLAALVPVVTLFAVYLDAAYANAPDDPVPFHPEFAYSWSNFPMHVFATNAGLMVRQELLYPAVLFYIVIAVVVMRRREWASSRAAILLTTVVALALYFLVPNSALGGDQVKIRFAWAIFLFGCLLATSVQRARVVRLPLSLFLTPFLGVSLFLCMRVNANLSRVMDRYAAAMSRVPSGATFARLRYPTPSLRANFGFGDTPLDPLFHMEAFVAANRRLIDLTDYQAASHVFPIVFRNRITKSNQDMLWSLEAPGTTGAAVFGMLRNDLPLDVDYAVIVGEVNTPEAKMTDLARMLEQLGSEMRLISGNGTGDFVRVYERIRPHAAAAQ